MRVLFYFQGLPDANAKICQARQDVLRFFNTNEESHSVIFLSGATTALKLAFEIAVQNSSSQFFAYLDECHTSVVGLRELTRLYEVWTSENLEQNLKNSQHSDGILAFPAMSNFNGQKFPMRKWTELARNRGFQVILDAASYVSSNYLNLAEIGADFVCLSFYKIFGYPTGLGALIVKNAALGTIIFRYSALCILIKKNNILGPKKSTYFSGGTVDMYLVNSSKHVYKNAEAGFEHGTLHYQGILALKCGFETIAKFGGMETISNRTFQLAKYLFEELASLVYENGAKVVELYSNNDFQVKIYSGFESDWRLLQSCQPLVNQALSKSRAFLIS